MRCRQSGQWQGVSSRGPLRLGAICRDTCPSLRETNHQLFQTLQRLCGADADVGLDPVLHRPADSQRHDRADKARSGWPLRYGNLADHRPGFLVDLFAVDLTSRASGRPRKPPQPDRCRHFRLERHDRVGRSGEHLLAAVSGAHGRGSRRGQSGPGGHLDAGRLLRCAGSAPGLRHRRRSAFHRNRASQHRRRAADRFSRSAPQRGDARVRRDVLLADGAGGRRPARRAAGAAHVHHCRANPAWCGASGATGLRLA